MKIVSKGVLIGILYLLTTCSAAYADSEDRIAGSHYVNLGSSFAAGSGITPVKPGSIERCRQSARNYASLLADKLDLMLEDVSCGGAKAEHILKPWNEIQPQISAINHNTRLVTITVGGNDLSYVTNLFANACSADGKFTIEGREIPCFKKKFVSEEDYQQLKHNLHEITAQIVNRAPRATIVFVQYVTLVPDELCAAASLTKEEADRIRLIGQRLANVTTQVAEESGIMLLPADQLSAEHTACDPEPWSIGATITRDNYEGIPWHPNARGHEGIADKLRQMLEL